MSSGSTKRSYPSSPPSASKRTRQHLITLTSSTKPPNQHPTTTSSPTCLDSSVVNGVLTMAINTFANTVYGYVPPTKCSNDISSRARNTTLNTSRCRNPMSKEIQSCVSRTSNINSQQPSPLHTTNTLHVGQLTILHRRTSVFIVNPQFCAVRT